jgi:hypothetical protein
MGRIGVFVAQFPVLATFDVVLYRRLLVGNHTVRGTPADLKSAIRQVGNLRYQLWAPNKWDRPKLMLLTEACFSLGRQCVWIS